MAFSVQTLTAGANYTTLSGTDSNTFRSVYRLSGGASETVPSTLGGNSWWSQIAMAFKGPSSSSSNPVRLSVSKIVKTSDSLLSVRI